MIAGDVEAPRYAASIMTASFLAASTFYGAWLGGHIPTVAQAVSRMAAATAAVDRTFRRTKSSLP